MTDENENENEFEEKINIMTLGNTTVGKTCFILKFTENRFQEYYIATIGLDFKMKTIQIKEKKYKIFFMIQQVKNVINQSH